MKYLAVIPFIVLPCFASAATCESLFARSKVTSATQTKIALGEEPRIAFDGLEPSAMYDVVALRGVLGKEDTHVQLSQFRVKATPEGKLDLARQAPEDGYLGFKDVDPWGAFWSQRTVAIKDVPATLVETGLLKNLTDEILRIGLLRGTRLEKQSEQAIVIRHPGVTVTRMDPEKTGFVGAYFQPKAELLSGRKAPALVVWSGSGGGFPADLGHFFAARGIPTLALQYFTTDPSAAKPYLPFLVREVPLEIFERAILWIKQQPTVDADRIAVLGGSRGGELSLLVGVHLGHLIKGVVAHRTSHVAWGSTITGAQIEGELKPEISSWSFRGRPIPYLSLGTKEHPLISPNRLADLIDPQPRQDGKMVLRLRASYDHILQLRTPEELAAARIPVEKIPVPILATGNRDDQMWPADTSTEIIRRTRIAHGLSARDRYVLVDGAGHLNNVPGTITSYGRFFQIMGSYLDKRDENGRRIAQPVIWNLGGDARTHHQSNLIITKETLSFLESIFGQRIEPLPLD